MKSVACYVLIVTGWLLVGIQTRCSFVGRQTILNVRQAGSFRLRKEGDDVARLKIPNQKILILDIEWRPAKAYIWQPKVDWLPPEMIIEDGGLLCVGAKWLGDKKTELFSEWEHGHVGMLERIHEMMSYADAIVGYNSDKFDIPKLHGEFLLHGLDPAPPCTTVDCLKAVKKMGFFMNRLAFIAPFLSIGAKMEHEGFGLWKKVMNGDADAQKRMAKYCTQDVNVTEKLYLKIRAHIRNHPHMGQTGHEACPSCGGKHVHSRGTRRTRSYKVQRLACQSCGHWFDGKRMKI